MTQHGKPLAVDRAAATGARPSEQALLPHVPLAEGTGILLSADIDAARQYITRALQQGDSAEAVHDALIAARNAGFKQRPAAAVLRHFDQLQSHLLSELNNGWQERLRQARAQLVSEANAHLVSEACNHWLKEGCVELYNFYHEMPIMARVRLLSARGDGLHVSCVEDFIWVVAAGEHRRTVFARVPLSEQSLRFTLSQVHGSGVKLKYAGMVRHEREKRKHIRVQCDEPVRISMRRDKGPWWHAMIHDVSESGLGISSSEPLPWKVDEKLLCHFSLHDHQVKGGALVRWRNEIGDRVRLGLELDIGPASKKQLQHEVAETSKRLINHLKIGGLPDSLAGVNISKV
ncbi:MAG: PilZ domain-containing protein [Mariprofundaceae bacterium]